MFERLNNFRLIYIVLRILNHYEFFMPYPSRNYRGLCDECRNLDWKVGEETTEQVLEKGLTTKEKAIRMKELREDSKVHNR